MATKGSQGTTKPKPGDTGPGTPLVGGASAPFLLPGEKEIKKLNEDLRLGLNPSQIKSLVSDVKALNGKLVEQTINGPVNVTTATAFTRAYLGLPIDLQSFLQKAWSLPAPGATDWSTASQAVVSQTQANGGDSSLVDRAQVADLTNKFVIDKQTNAAAMRQASISSQMNAFDKVQTYLGQWGLGGMADYVKGLVTKDGSYLTNVDALLNAVRNYKAPNGSSPYDQAFPGLRQRNSSLGPGSEHMTEDQYQQYVQQVQGLAGQYAFPQGFITKEHIGNWIANNVSSAELEQRMKYGYEAAQNADARTKQILQQQYGMNMGQLAAYMLDPKHALATIEKQVASATLQGYAQDVGLKGISQAQGEELANMVNIGAGTIGSGDITTRMSGVQSALLQASRDQPLTAKAPGTSGTTIDTNQLIGAQLAGFGGTTQAADQAAVQRAEQSRTAQFQQGGGFEENQKGVIGAGSAKI
jgi:hypothetical protein